MHSWWISGWLRPLPSSGRYGHTRIGHSGRRPRSECLPRTLEDQRRANQSRTSDGWVQLVNNRSSWTPMNSVTVPRTVSMDSCRLRRHWVGFQDDHGSGARPQRGLGVQLRVRPLPLGPEPGALRLGSFPRPDPLRGQDRAAVIESDLKRRAHLLPGPCSSHGGRGPCLRPRRCANRNARGLRKADWVQSLSSPPGGHKMSQRRATTAGRRQRTFRRPGDLRRASSDVVSQREFDSGKYCSGPCVRAWDTTSCRGWGRIRRTSSPSSCWAWYRSHRI